MLQLRSKSSYRHYSQHQLRPGRQWLRPRLCLDKAKRPNNLQLILEAWDPLNGYEAFLGDLEPVIQARKDIKIIFGGDFNP